MTSPEVKLIIDKLNHIESILSNQKADRWLNIHEASDHVGLSSSTIRRNAMSGRLKVTKKTGKLLFKRSWLDSFLEG